ncbi:2-hydroxyacid dehydrogenase [Larkinella knui]|uniref:Phosphoglycerate dehydrogenase n=1 Tax=Larkinella knui TaxID=2025310 RepID=A0A3P1CUF9_9BACT|nr:2-hydroxyacid dehydrogenase [Larkinella knui]RRB16776.1 phosphoglycerate dehydrogenase [Larkinella knui]
MSQIQPIILIADEMHPSLFPMLEQAGFAFRYEPTITRSALIDQIAEYDGLLIRSKTAVDADVLNPARRLRFIGRAGAGLDLIDLDITSQRNIQVFHAGEGNRDAVAEHTVGMLLGLLANIAKGDREVRRGIWDREGNRGYELSSLTVGIVGFGNNGHATARRLSGFGCRVLCYDKYLTRYGGAYAQEAEMEQIMEEADVLSLHVPLTAETRMMINDAFIARFEKPFYLINIARGEVVSLSALVRGLESGKIRGACLDVLENEKLSRLTPDQQAAFDYLRNSDHVVLTPHVAGWTHESYVRINEVLVSQLKHVR